MLNLHITLVLPLDSPATPPTFLLTCSFPPPPPADLRSLPAELLARILKFAQEGETPEDQLKIRLGFERACKGFYLCELSNRYQSVALDGLADVGRLATALSAAAVGNADADVALKVKSLTATVEGASRLITQEELASLLSLLLNLETVDVLIVGEWLGGVHDRLGRAVTAALAKLANVKHFTIRGEDSARSRAYTRIAAGMMAKLLPKWTRHESLTLNRCNLVGDWRKVFLSSSTLHTVILVQLEGCLKSLVLALPPSVRVLEINHAALFDSSQLSFITALNETERFVGLTSLTMLDGSPRRNPSDRAKVARGQLDSFVENLDSVTSLATSPVAVTDLASLAKLKKLSHLELRVGRAIPKTWVSPGEVVNLLNDTNSIKHLTISDSIRNGWSDPHRAWVDAQAFERTITLQWDLTA